MPLDGRFTGQWVRFGIFPPMWFSRSNGNIVMKVAEFEYVMIEKTLVFNTDTFPLEEY